MHKAHAVLAQAVVEYRKSALCVLKANASVNEQLLCSMTGGWNILINDTWATKNKTTWRCQLSTAPAYLQNDCGLKKSKYCGYNCCQVDLTSGICFSLSQAFTWGVCCVTRVWQHNARDGSWASSKKGQHSMIEKYSYICMETARLGQRPLLVSSRGSKRAVT